MTPFERSDRCCPEYRSTKYVFRARRTVKGTSWGQFVETKYRCRDCAHEWCECILKTVEPRRG